MGRPLTVTDWSKGITDNYIDAPAGYSEKLNNLFINRIGKPYQRPGLAPLGDYAQIPSGNQQIDAIYYFDSTIFVKSGTKLYFIDESTVTTSWTTLAGPAHDAFADSEVGGKATWSEWRGHLLITPAPSSTKKGGCRTVKVYRNNSNVWTLVQAGLPRAVEDGTGVYSGPTYTTGQVNYAFTWWVVYYRTYTAKVNGVSVTFEDFGAPDVLIDQGDAISSGNDVDIGIYEHVNSSLENYDTSNMSVKLYRTKRNGTVPFLSKTVAMNAQITDDVEDSALTTEGYGGLSDGNNNDPPPLSYFHTLAGSVSWFLAGVDLDSGALRANRVWQGRPANIDGVPSGNFLDIEGDIATAFDHAGVYPVAFFKGQCFRIEGQIDLFGGGALRAVAISNEEGSVTADVCRAGKGIYFQSMNGFCYTNGFTVVNLSKHLPTRFGQLSVVHKSSAAYDPFGKRVFFGVADPDLSDVNEAINSAWVLDENFPHKGPDGEPEGCITTMSADDDFRPTSMHYDVANKRMLFGDAQGFVMTFDEDSTMDFQVDGSTFTTVTETKAIVYDWISAAWSFGDRVATKWVSEFLAVFKNLTGKLSIDGYSHNDDKTSTLAIGRIRERSTAGAGMHRVRRYFPRGGLRCFYKQLQLRKGLANLHRSDDYATATVTIDGFEGELVLASGDWPDGDDGSSLVGYYIYLDDDEYATGFRIISVSGNTMRVDNDDEDLIAGIGTEWLVKGYPKDEGMELHSVAVSFDVIEDGTAVVAMGEDGGTNA